LILFILGEKAGRIPAKATQKWCRGKAAWRLASRYDPITLQIWQLRRMPYRRRSLHSSAFAANFFTRSV